MFRRQIMLRVNVGLSRKLSKDYNSTGYSVNLDGEVTAPASDPEGVIEQVRELFDLAEEALNVQVERSQSVDAIASHDEGARPQAHNGRNGNGANGNGANGSKDANGTNGSNGTNGTNGSNRPNTEQRRSQGQASNGNGRNGNGRQPEPATNKQIQFLLNLGKKQRMSKLQLEGRVAEILGCECGIYDLTKQDACVILDTLTAGNGR
jgi:hypothetical protein